MPVADIVITVAIVISMVIGFVRGFVKEAISIAALLLAIWTALNFGPQVGNLSESWLSSEDLQAWFGRILIFVVVLVLGGLIGWGVSKLVRLSVLSGADRGFGTIFGFCRGVILVAVAVIGGQFMNFDNDPWWQRSVLLPYAEVVADWIRIMAPKGVEFLTPDGAPESVPVAMPDGG